MSDVTEDGPKQLQKVGEARLYVASGNVLFGASAGDHFDRKSPMVCQTRRHNKR